MSEPYDQQPGETCLWFRRFRDFYLLVGTERYLDDSFRRHLVSRGANPAAVARRRAPGAWRTQAKRWRWADRARAYDERRRGELHRALKAKFDAELEATRQQWGRGRHRATSPG